MSCAVSQLCRRLRCWQIISCFSIHPSRKDVGIPLILTLRIRNHGHSSYGCRNSQLESGAGCSSMHFSGILCLGIFPGNIPPWNNVACEASSNYKCSTINLSHSSHPPYVLCSSLPAERRYLWESFPQRLLPFPQQIAELLANSYSFCHSPALAHRSRTD